MPDEAQPKQDVAAIEPDEAEGGVDWHALIVAASKKQPDLVDAHTYLGKWKHSAAKLGCSNGRSYAVKGTQVGRMAYNDQVAARFARVLLRHRPVLCDEDFITEGGLSPWLRYA